MNRRNKMASPAFLSLIWSTTLLAFLGVTLAYFNTAFDSIKVFPYPFTAAALSEREWPLNVLVGANSPNLCPTIFSVTYTGINFLPLCTAKVYPIKSGIIVERRDHVFISFFSPLSIINFTFFISFSSTKGPFFKDLANLLPPLDNKLNGSLIAPRSASL